MLDLSFETEELRALCEDGAVALERYGREVAQALWNRIADLRAASHPLDVPLASTRPGAGASPSELVIPLPLGYSLVLAAAHRRPPVDADGALLWERVSRVIILRVEPPRG